MSPEAQRIGRFRISAVNVRNDWRRCLPLFAHVVVVRAEMMYYSDSIEYLALSDLFDEIALGVEAPLYEMCIHSDGRVQAFPFGHQPTPSAPDAEGTK